MLLNLHDDWNRNTSTQSIVFAPTQLTAKCPACPECGFMVRWRGGQDGIYTWECCDPRCSAHRSQNTIVLSGEEVS